MIYNLDKNNEIQIKLIATIQVIRLYIFDELIVFWQ